MTSVIESRTYKSDTMLFIVAFHCWFVHVSPQWLARLRPAYLRNPTDTVTTPRSAPAAITLSVVWMEREFDAYKLSRCMCSSNYNRFWDTARYLSKIVNFFIPPCIQRPPLGRVRSRWNSATPFGTEKLEWLVTKFRDKISKIPSLFVVLDLYVTTTTVTSPVSMVFAVRCFA